MSEEHIRRFEEAQRFRENIGDRLYNPDYPLATDRRSNNMIQQFEQITETLDEHSKQLTRLENALENHFTTETDLLEKLLHTLDEYTKK